MKRRKKLFVVGSLLSLLLAAVLIIYLAYPRVLLKAVIAVQRSDAGFEHKWVRVQDWNLPSIDTNEQGDEKETILLVHGFGDNKDSFLDLAVGHTDDYRIMAVDLPGFGQTAIRTDQDYSATFYVRMLLGFLDQLDVDSVHLVGYSMGGMLAVKVAAQSPDRVRTLTLLAPAGLLGDQPSEMDRIIAEGKGNPLTYRDRENFERLVRLNFHQPLDLPDFAVRAVVAEGRERADLHELIFNKLFNPADIPEFEKEVAALTIPTLVIWGTRDRIVHVSATDRWSRLNPNLRVVKLPEVGHDLIHEAIPKIHEELRSHFNASATPRNEPTTP